MKIVVQKNNLRCQILYRSLVPIKKASFSFLPNISRNPKVYANSGNKKKYQKMSKKGSKFRIYFRLLKSDFTKVNCFDCSRGWEFQSRSEPYGGQLEAENVCFSGAGQKRGKTGLSRIFEFEKNKIGFIKAVWKRKKMFFFNSPDSVKCASKWLHRVP